jgi:hypothetical protein
LKSFYSGVSIVIGTSIFQMARAEAVKFEKCDRGGGYE